MTNAYPMTATVRLIAKRLWPGKHNVGLAAALGVPKNTVRSARGHGLASGCHCLRFGMSSARSCVASCFALMAIAIAAHGLATMVCVQVIMFRERYQRRLSSPTGSTVCALILSFLGDALVALSPAIS